MRRDDGSRRLGFPAEVVLRWSGKAFLTGLFVGAAAALAALLA